MEKMLRVKEVMEILKYSENKSYKLIKKLKEKNRLFYKESIISEKILKEYFGLDKA